MRTPVRFTPQHPLRKVVAAFNIALIATLATVGLRHVPLVAGTMSDLDDTLYDRLYHCRKFEDRTAEPIVIIAVDEESIRRLNDQGNEWPWPRQIWASIIQYMQACGARAVVIDVQFQDDRDFDKEFAAALDGAKIPVVIATQAQSDGRPGRFAPPVKRPVDFGATNLLEEKTSRKYPWDVNGLPTLAVAAARAAKAPTWRWSGQPFLIRYFGPHERADGRKTYRYISAYAPAMASFTPAAAASVGISPGMFRDKIVLIGGTATGTFDLKSSPLSKIYPGVEVHASAIDDLLNGQIVEPIGFSSAFIITFVAALMAGLGVIFPRRALLKCSLALAAWAIFAGCAIGLFCGRNVHWLPMASPIVAIVIATLGAFAWSYLKEDRQRRFVVKALSQYTSPEIVAEIEKSDSALELGGERREITVLFTDLQGFTDLSESMAPEKLATVINYYMTEMSGVILSTNGTVAQYLGDGIMAFWSAPIMQPDHVVRACRAALGMRKRETEIVAEMAKLGAKNVVTRIGLNTGPMVFGNLGSRQKFSYGVLGDNVNLGSRLEGANKIYGSRILVAESTALAVKDQFVVRRLDDLRVKGKLKAVGVYELMAEGKASGNLAAQVEGYSNAFALYQSQKWDDADAILKELLMRCPDDKPAAALLHRIEKLRHDPPPADWDGVYIAKDK